MANKLYRNAGYYLTATSWENDSDNYQTHSLHYTDENKLRNDIKLIQLCTSKNNRQRPGIGNTSDNDISDIIEVFYNLIKANPGIIPVSLDELEGDEDPIDLANTLISYLPMGLGLTNSDYYLVRVLQSFSVEYFAEDVFCEDLTEKFVDT